MNIAYLESLQICFWYFVVPLWGLVYIDEHLKNQLVSVGETARFVCLTAIHPVDQQEVVVEWTHDDHPVNLTQYQKYSYQRKDNQHILIIENTQYTDSGEYSCQATAGTVVDVSSAHLTVLGVPAPPNNLQLISCHGQSAELVWEPGDDHGATITLYTVHFNTSHEPDRWHVYSEPFNGETTNALVSVSPWGTYAFRVIARNSAGSSEPSNVTSSTCSAPPDKPDRNPKDVRTRTDIKGKLAIEWKPMERLYQHGPGFRYHVFWRQSSSTYWNSAYENNADADSYEVDVDDVFGLYDIRVKAENDLGESHQPAFVFKGHSGEAEPVVVPKDFRLDRSRPLTPNTAHFIWEAVDMSVEKIKGQFQGYRIQYWKSSEGRHKMKQIDIMVSHKQKNEPDVRAVISGLPSYTAVRAQVVVINTHYTGQPSQIIDFFVPEGVPEKVRQLRADSVGMTYVLLKWLPPETPNGVLVGYHIDYQQVVNISLGPVIPLHPEINNPSTLGARITGLQPHHAYRFHVSAKTKEGLGLSDVVDIRTVNGTPPSAVLPYLVKYTPTTANITWLTTDLTSRDHFFIEFKRPGERQWQRTLPVLGQHWVVLGNLTHGVVYNVRVVARNALSDVATSHVIQVNTAWPVTEASKETIPKWNLQKKKAQTSKAERVAGSLFLVVVEVLVMSLWL